MYQCGQNILNKCDVLHKGSLNHFHKEIKYNFCKQILDLLPLTT